MSGLQWRGATWVLVAAVLVATLLVAGSVLIVPDPPRRMALPSAGELVELERYLDPADVALADSEPGAAEGIVRGDPFGAGGAAWTAGSGRGAESRRGGGGARAGSGSVGQRSGAVQRPEWTLSAIMIAGDRKIAILNDQMVRAGDRLEDGVRVERVESDHIVIITPAGQRRRLELERQGP